MKISTLFSFIAFSSVALAITTKKTSTSTKATSTTASKATGDASSSDCDIIKDVFDGLNAANVTYPWFTDVKNCCNNKEFTCVNNKIEEINLNSVKLEIPLSDKIGELTNLKKLSLAKTGLIGAIPSGLFKSTNLEIIELNDNKLNSTIAKEFGDLKKLKTLNLNNNNLNGDIPESLFKIDTLENVNLANNKVTGKIPQLSKDLKTCSFSGTSLCTTSKLDCDSSLSLCEKKGLSTPALIGIILGGIALLIILLLLVCCCVKSSKSKDKSFKENSEQKLTSKGSLSSISSKSSRSSTSSSSSSSSSKVNANNISVFQPLPEITRENIYDKKDESFVLLDIPESVKGDFVEDLVDANPALLSPFLSKMDEASNKSSRSSVASSCSSSCSSCSSCSSGSSVSQNVTVPPAAVVKSEQPQN